MCVGRFKPHTHRVIFFDVSHSDILECKKLNDEPELHVFKSVSFTHVHAVVNIYCFPASSRHLSLSRTPSAFFLFPSETHSKQHRQTDLERDLSLFFFFFLSPLAFLTLI